MSAKKTTKDDRTRNWTFIVYPDSAPSNWRDILEDEHIQWVESPLHDSDYNTADEIKKSHWHILLMYEGNKTYNQILEVSTSVNGTIPQKVASAKGLVRYMVHMDNPEKHQYDKSAIVSHGGADINELLKPTSSSRYQMIKEMLLFIQEQNIIEMEDLLLYSCENRFDDWFPLLCDNSAYIIGSFLKSRRHRIPEKTNIVRVDSDGVILE